MLDADIVAKYFLSKDPNRKLFNNNVVINNDTKSYEGNIRLNKYLFLSQVVFLARFEKKLIRDNFVAYKNGPIVKNIMNNYPHMVDKNESVEISEDIKSFLDKIYFALENATYEELIDITHEDPEWIKLSNDTYSNSIMDLESNIDIYKKRYDGLIKALKL